MKRIIVIAALILGACGAEGAPELTNLRASSRRAQIGTEVFLRAGLFDMDGDLEAGVLLGRVRSVDGDIDLEEASPILGFEDGRTRGDVIMGLTLLGIVDIGDYDVSLVAEDAAGVRSERLTQRITYSR
jgi:hypothetical protein